MLLFSCIVAQPNLAHVAERRRLYSFVYTKYITCVCSFFFFFHDDALTDHDDQDAVMMTMMAIVMMTTTHAAKKISQEDGQNFLCVLIEICAAEYTLLLFLSSLKILLSCQSVPEYQQRLKFSCMYYNTNHT